MNKIYNSPSQIYNTVNSAVIRHSELPSCSEELLEEQGNDSELDFDRLLDEFIASEKSKLQQSDEDDNNDEESAPGTYDDGLGDETDASDSIIFPTLDEMLSPLVGLTGVKARLAAFEKVMKFNRLRYEQGLTMPSMPLHAMFLGSPGTGKTTVANMIGRMLASIGVLSRGHVVVRERASLLGQYYSSESDKIRGALEEARGGILFIDEAYQLWQPNDSKDPGRFVIESLLTALSDERDRDWMLILAGYPEEMRSMFDMNPGLKSRIPESNIYMFEDFTEAELMEIAENYLGDNNFTLSPEARTRLGIRLASDYARRDRSFGNGRHVINLIQTQIIPAMADRVISADSPCVSLTEIQGADIPAPAPAAAVRRRVGYRA